MKYCRKTIDTWQVLTYSQLTKGWVQDYLYYDSTRASERSHTLVSQGFRARVVKRRRRIHELI
jgi:hypothetical protein